MTYIFLRGNKSSFLLKNEVLPISELFDMAASPVRKLLNPQFGETNDLETTTSSTLESSKDPDNAEDVPPRKTPLSTQDLMVLNERSMLVAKYQDRQINQDDMKKEHQELPPEKNLIIVNAVTTPAQEIETTRA